MLIRPIDSPRAARRAAFTLLEVLIVVAIIVVLAGVSSIYVFRYLEDAKEGAAKAGMKTIETACKAYEIKIGQLPNSLQDLLQPPDGGKPYLENGTEGLNDPWGKPYSYDASGGHNGGQKPDVWTTTPDGRMIGNWPGGH
jgi:general secretion pathway protein G